MQSPEPAEHWYSLVCDSSSVIELYLDDELIARPNSLGASIEWLLWDINRASAASDNSDLLFHAGGVGTLAGGVLLPAPSGSGKSTLVASLVESGFEYLSDELVALRGDLLLPYPKPVTLKSGSFDALSHLRPVVEESLMADEWYVRPQDIRPDAIGSPRGLMAVVAPNYTVGASTSLTPLSHTDAFLALVINSVNLEHHGSKGTAVLGRIAEQIPCFELRYSDTFSACRSIMEVASLTTQRAS
ncbi:MAG TPA: hypothetical protein VGG38_01870 [Acidimicrobiales bacterium]